MEWTRCHLGEQEEEEASRENSSSDDTNTVPIGQVRVVQADFSIDGDDVGPYPTDSLYAKELGGGVSWCVLPYIVAASMLPFDSKYPDKIAANGIVPTKEEEIGDLAMGMTLTFNNNNAKNEVTTSSPPGNKSIASGVCSYLAESCEITMYAAKRGRIIVESPAHCPTSASIVRKFAGKRGNGSTSDPSDDDDNVDNNNGKLSNYTVTFPLPPTTPEIESSGGIKLPNSMGLIYEAEAVRRLIDAGELTFPQWTPEESVGCIRIIEEMLRQVKCDDAAVCDD